MLNSACFADCRHACKKRQLLLHGPLTKIQQFSLALQLVWGSMNSSTCKLSWTASTAFQLPSPFP